MPSLINADLGNTSPDFAVASADALKCTVALLTRRSFVRFSAISDVALGAFFD